MCAYADANQPPAGFMEYHRHRYPESRGFAECRVRRQAMDGKEEEEFEMPGSTRESPQYSLSVTCVPQPILTHKLAESYSGEKLDALKRLVNGGCMGDQD